MRGAQYALLGDVVRFDRGLTYAKSDEVEVSSNIVLRANNIDLESAKLDLSELRYIKDNVEVPATKRVQAGSILICTASGSKAHVGKVAFIDRDYGYAFGGFMGQITPIPSLNARYLYYALTSSRFRAHLERLVDGANINNLKFNQVASFGIMLPPISEQQRIVAILDEALDGIATATAACEQRILLSEAILAAALCRSFPADGPDTQPLSAVASFSGGAQPPKSTFSAEMKPGFVRFIQIRDFKSDKHLVHIPVAKNNRMCVANDILIGRYGASVGQIHRGLAGAYNVALMKAVPDQAVLNPEYFYLYLRSETFQRRLANVAGRSAQAGFSKTDIAAFPVPVPSMQAQEDIAANMSSLRLEISNLKAGYSRQRERMTALKQSLLHQAFTGQL